MVIRKTRSKKNIILRKYIKIIGGSFLMALAVNLIYEPLGLVTGGLAGFAIIIKEITRSIIDGGIPIWFVTVVLNVPLFIVSIKLLGIRTMINVTIGTLTYIIAMMVIPIYDLQFDDMLYHRLWGVLTELA